ncbi:MAG: hypothetical protein IT262_00780 [Saprospiraceae bacterium]|nr:hypothetical protein [Saprospiraceae bacterium]
MDNNFLLTDDMLWDYADGFLAREEKMQVDAYLSQNPEHRSRLDAILAEKRAFSALPLDRPKAGFADLVMAAWVAEQSGNPSLATNKGKDWIIYCIAAAMGFFILLPIVLIIVSAPTVSTDIIPAEYIPQAPAIPWVKIFTSPIMRFGMPLTLLFFCFRFLDQYLQQKKMSHL